MARVQEQKAQEIKPTEDELQANSQAKAADPETYLKAQKADLRAGVAGVEGVRYLGRANIRRLSAADLERMGATDVSGDLEWSKEDGNVIPANGLSQSVIDTLAKHPEFEVV